VCAATQRSSVPRMTGDAGTTTGRTPGGPAPDDDRIDAAAWWQLVGLTVIGAAGPVLYFVLRPGSVPWPAVVVLGLALAVTLPASQVRTWSRWGGRAAVVATRSWVRSGRVPADVPDAVWRPRLERWAGDLQRRRVRGWTATGVTVIWAVIALMGTPADWIVVVLWAAIAIQGLVPDRRGRGVAERLLATPSVGAGSTVSAVPAAERA